MAKPVVNFKDLAPIEPGNPAWQTVSALAEAEIQRLRDKREELVSDQRKLDVALGGITALKMLLELPAAIKRDRQREPVTGDGFGIPAPPGF